MVDHMPQSMAWRLENCRLRGANSNAFSFFYCGGEIWNSPDFLGGAINDEVGEPCFQFRNALNVVRVVMGDESVRQHPVAKGVQNGLRLRSVDRGGRARFRVVD